MLKVKINNKWIDDVRFISKDLDSWYVFTGDWTNLVQGQIQDIKWVEDESSEIEEEFITKKQVIDILDKIEKMDFCPTIKSIKDYLLKDSK